MRKQLIFISLMFLTIQGFSQEKLNKISVNPIQLFGFNITNFEYERGFNDGKLGVSFFYGNTGNATRKVGDYNMNLSEQNVSVKGYLKPINQKNNFDSLQTVKDSTDETKKAIRYSDQQLEIFLDSIGKLPSKPLIDKVSFMTDSIFENQQQLDISVKGSDFEKLKQGCKVKHLDINTVKAIFGDIKIDSAYLKDGIIPLTFVSFDKNKNDFKEFAVCPDYADAGWSCEMYFFSGKKIIAKHNINHRYGLELKHYKDNDGRTVVYYKENYQSGSGIWWFNFYFYKYYDNKLIPILNELENVNLQFPWSIRVLWLESTIQKINPLTLKMVYYQAFSDSAESPKYINDSTLVQYTWDEKTKALVGNYEKSKISKAQIMTYYLEENELLFINAYYKTLKANLHDKILRQSTLNYLNEVKNHYDNN